MGNQKDKIPTAENTEAARRDFEEWKKRKKEETRLNTPEQKRKLAERYRKLREKCRDKDNKPMKLTTFAVLTGIKKQNIEQMENPECCRPMSRASAQAYRNVIKANRGFDVSYEYLFGESDTFDVRHHNFFQYTGLKEETVNKLHDLKQETNGLVSSLIDLMLEDDLNLIVNLAYFMLFKPTKTVEGAEIREYQMNEKGEFVVEEYPLTLSPELQEKALLFELYDDLMALKEKKVEKIENSLSGRSE